MLPTYILGISIILQFAAAIAALWLIRITGRQWAWVMIATALTFMGVRRCVTFYGVTLDHVPYQADITAELVALGISALMLLGVVSLAPIFLAFRRSAEALRQKNLFLRLLQKITAAANASSDYSQAMQTALDAICQHTGWPIGHLYVVSKREKDVLEPTKLWHLQNPERFKVFRQVTESTRFQTGSGLPGRVHASGKPAWIIDVTGEADIPRAKVASDIGVKSSFAFPVLVGDETAAVLEFFSSDVAEPDEALHDVMVSVGTELGRVIERERSREAIEHSKQMIRSIVDSTTAVISIKDLDGRYLLVNRRFEELFNASGETVLGKSAHDIFPEELADTFCANDRKVIERQEPIEFEEAAIHPDEGELHMYASEKFPLYDLSGNIYAVCGISTDITERNRRENKLRCSQFIVDHAGDAVFAIDSEGRFINVNVTACSRLGYSRQELLGMYVWDISPEHPQDTWPAIWKRISEEDRLVIETLHQTKSGRRFPVEIVAKHIQVEGEECSCALARDITERKQAEAALKESEERFSLFMDHLPGLAHMKDENRRIIYLNKHFDKTFGISRNDWLGKTVHDIFPPEIAASLHESDEPVFSHQRLVEVIQDIQQDDGIHHYLTRRFPIPRDSKTTLMGCISIDITDRVCAEEKLKEQTARLQAVFQSVPDSLILTDRSRRVLLCNPGMTRIYGYEPEEIIGQTPRMLYADQEEYEEQGRIRYDPQSIDNLRPYVVRYRHKNGRVFAGETVAGAVLSKDGEVIGCLGLVRDITERVQTEEALRRSEQRFRSIFEQAGVAVGLIESHTGRFVRVNSRYTELVGYSAEEMIGMTWMDITHPDDIQEERDNIRRLKKGKNTQFTMEERILHKNGSLIWINLTVSPIWNADERPSTYVAIVQDITAHKQAEMERKHLEEELLHAQKLKAIGTLAGGIAHDFNNVLTAIFGHIEIAKKDVPQSHPVCESLGTIERVAKQGEAVTRALLTFSHKTPVQKHLVDLAVLVEESLRMLRRLLPASIRVIEDLPRDTDIWIEADTGQLQQVLMNLTVNARDAMPDGGIIRISLSREQGEAAVGLNNEPGPAYGWAVLKIDDTGPGMDEDTRSRIFEPFFTTKPRGNGTGLGLAIVHGIVKDHGGRIDVSSEEGVGSCFVIRLPICDPHDVVAPYPPQDRGAKPGKGETILLAEDNEFVRDVMTTALRSGGYHVVSAADGEEAMNLFKTHRDEVSLAILDLDMPKMSGTSCLAQIREEAEELPVVIVTGNVDLFLKMNSPDMPPILTKPFQMAELVELVKKTQPSTGKGGEA